MVAGEMAVMFVAEPGAQGIARISLQLAGKARQLANRLGSKVGAILLGNGLSTCPGPLIEAGADLVLLGEMDECLASQAEISAPVIVDIVQRYRPEILLVGSTARGRELAPRVAAKLETGLTAHCTGLAINQAGCLEQYIPAYGGMMTILCPDRRPQMATVAEGVFPNPTQDASRMGQVIPIDIPTGLEPRAQTMEIVLEKGEGKVLEAAPFIVAGGAGVGDLDGWLEVAELASLLDAGLGSTRPVVDAGWADFDTMIGQSGKFVNPELYIGIGVSGDLQHMVGLASPRLMIAINNEPKSRIFSQVDIGVVEDCRTFVPALMKAIEERKKDNWP